MKEEENYSGKILISNSSVVTDFFNQTVVLMVEHDSDGAFGLVINKESEFSASEVIQGLPDGIGLDFPVYSGGPVDPNFVSILHDNSEVENPGIEILPDLYFGRSFDLLLSLIETNSDFHLYQGYSGWGANQLESEMERLSWVVHEPQPNWIFTDRPEVVWREALKSKGGLYKYFAEHTKDPLLN